VEAAEVQAPAEALAAAEVPAAYLAPEEASVEVPAVHPE
jgi:hypothetical protein